MTIRTVLIVDDSKTDSIYLAELLHRNGYLSMSAGDATQAQAQLEQFRPDMILMDVVMPGKNGFQLTRILQRDARYADIPIVLCTSKDQDTDRIWGLRQGASGYLVKPVREAELLRQIEALD